ncbi:MAG: VTT domain-containing protein [Bacilli bacterium]|nr:VTT domain-containing protein [Bacilli bacterium]
MEKDIEIIKRRKKIITRISFAIITLAVVAILFFLFRNIILEVLRLTKANDNEGLKEFMRSKGWLGYIAVVLVEALEMVVVFMPAEFIQIPAGLSFFFPIAILLCDVGVCLGASIIYFLVHVLKFDNEFIAKGQKKIKNLATRRKNQNTQILMYFLFVTPIIPFGAICYWASSTKISYRRYILTCFTGVIPSIVTSIIMGTSIKYFIAEALPIWLLVIIIICLGAILFIGMFLISRKFLFDGKKVRGTPNSIYMPIAGTLMGLYVKRTTRLRVIEDDNYQKMGSIPGAKLYLINHLSANDIYHIYKAIDPDRPALLANKYYMRWGFARWFINKLGFIPKTLYNPDIEAIKKTLKYAKDNTSIMMFPEARLSLDGTTGPLTSGTSSLVKKLGLPVVLFEISGNYLANSKYRKAQKKVITEVRVKRIIEKSELDNLELDQIDEIIRENLAHNEFEYAKKREFKDNNKAENLDKVLYLCPHCHQEFRMHANGNKLECECGFSLELDNHYQFNDNEYGIKTIHDFYEFIKAEEKKNIEVCGEAIISQEVDVKKISFKNKKYDVLGEGVCTVTKHGFSFEGKVGQDFVSFSHPKEALQALPFSVGEEYECYYNNELYYFYPKTNKNTCVKVALIYDLIQEMK